MSKTRSITELVNELQRENESLTGLKKGFNTMCKAEFDLSIEQIHKIIKKANALEQKFSSDQEIQKPYYSSHISNES